MQINGPGSVPGPIPNQPRRNVNPTPPPASGPSAMRPVDELELSSAGKLLDSANNSSDVRAERLARIKSEIESGVYETPEKLEAALMRLLGQIESGDE